MNDWLMHVKTEWKLLYRGPFLWLLALSSIGLGWLIYAINRDAVNTYTLVQQFGFLYSGPLSIGALLAGIYGAHRDRGLKVDRILSSLPYRSGRMLLSRFLVMALPFVFANLAMAGILIYHWGFQLSREPDIAYPMMILLVLAFGIAYAVALGWAVGVFIVGRSSYLVGFLLWFVHVYGGFLIINSLLPSSLFALPNFLLMDYKSMGYMDEVWGFVRDSSLWWHRGFYSSLTGLILMLIVWVIKSRRKEAMARVWIYGLLIVFTVGTLGSAIAYSSVRGAHIDSYRNWEAGLAAHAAAASTPEPAPFTIINYDLAVSYKDEAASLEVQAALTIQTTGKDQQAVDRLELTLNPAFQIERAFVNGQEEKLQRDAYVVTISLSKPLAPKEQANIQLAYQGAVDDWRLIHPYGQGAPKLVQVNSATSSQLLLTGAGGWYPIAGKQSLIIENKEKQINSYSKWLDHYPVVDKADYRVITDFPVSLELFSNLDKTSASEAEGRQRLTFEGKGFDGAALAAGPLQEFSSANDSALIKLLTSQWMSPAHASAFLKMADANIRHINELLGTARTPMTWLAFEPSTFRSGGNWGGVVMVNSNLLNERELDTTASYSFTQQYVELLTRSGYRQSYSLGVALSAYIASGRKEKPVKILSNNPQTAVKLEAFMNDNSKEEVERMLLRMYQLLLDNPDQPLNLNIILDTGGPPIAKAASAH
ncbi:MAG: hypothetical protein K0R67_3449 [Paenibacillus sp.]|nr:hypothetical protein [Paenibacillus sp.]